MSETWETELIGSQIYGSGIFGTGYYGSVEWTDGTTPSATWSNLTDTASTWTDLTPTTVTWSDTQVGKLATVGTWDDPGDNDDGTYYNINLYGGSGSNARATVTVTNGIMTNVTLKYTSSTSGYRVGDVLNISKDTLDGSYANNKANTSIITDTTTRTEA